jgi:hypothetical protein
MLLLLLAGIITGCKPPIQERQGVPIVMGMRLDGGTTENDIFDNFHWLAQHHLSDLLVEVPFQASFSPPHRPLVDSLVLDQIAVLATECHTRKIKFHLALLTQNQMELFPKNRLEQPDGWFLQLEMVLHHLMNACGPYPPQRVILGENLQVAESYATKWESTFDHFRQRWQVPISYCSYSDRGSAEKLWAISDEICISYSSATDEDGLPFTRTQNLHISKLAQKWYKPVFIARANLLGNFPEKLFDYRLRHWDEGIDLKGLCINTIYSRLSPLDSSSYYGIKDHDVLLKKLDDYTGQQKER